MLELRCIEMQRSPSNETVKRSFNQEALALIEVRLLDHFVVGGVSQPVSLAARGWV